MLGGWFSAMQGGSLEFKLQLAGWEDNLKVELHVLERKVSCRLAGFLNIR
jgi:hypothetical protein